MLLGSEGAHDKATRSCTMTFGLFGRLESMYEYVQNKRLAVTFYLLKW